MANHICHHGEMCVSLVPIFNHLEQNQMNEVMQTVQSMKYQKGEIIYHAGDVSNALYIVHHGRIKIYRLAESGKEKLVRILKPGDFTGELALFQDSGLHEAYAEALSEVDLCIIRREDLQDLLLKYPSIALKVLQEFSTRLEDTERQTTSFATEKVEMRIAHFLVECLDEVDDENNEITLPMSKKDLASYLGTTPETLSRRLTDFEDEGLIEQNGQRNIKIMNVDDLLLV